MAQEDDTFLFEIRDPSGKYTPDGVAALLLRAEQMGHPLEKGSYIQHLTISQLDALVNGRFDA